MALAQTKKQRLLFILKKKFYIGKRFSIIFKSLLLSIETKQYDEKVDNFGSGSNNHGKEHENYRGKD